MARRRRPLDRAHDPGTHTVWCYEGPDGEPVWAVYAWPEGDKHMVAEKGEMDMIGSGLTYEAACDLAASQRFVRIS